MDLKLKLAERQRLAAVHVRLEDGSEGLEFPAFDVDLEDVDVGVAVELHEAGESVHGGGGCVLMVVLACQAERLEVSASEEGRVVLDLWAEAGDGEVVAPDLAAAGA